MSEATSARDPTNEALAIADLGPSPAGRSDRRPGGDRRRHRRRRHRHRRPGGPRRRRRDHHRHRRSAGSGWRPRRPAWSASASQEGDGFVEELGRQPLRPGSSSSPARLDEVRRQLDEYFEGDRRTFDLTVDFTLTGASRRIVLERLFAEIGFGETLSYLELARRSGSPKASRSRGLGDGDEPGADRRALPPALRTGGQLGGYGGGLDVKRYLLAHEGADGAGQQRLL